MAKNKSSRFKLRFIDCISVTKDWVAKRDAQELASSARVVSSLEFMAENV
jgi:hypothetical protein